MGRGPHPPPLASSPGSVTCRQQQGRAGLGVRTGQCLRWILSWTLADVKHCPDVASGVYSGGINWPAVERLMLSWGLILYLEPHAVCLAILTVEITGICFC